MARILVVDSDTRGRAHTVAVVSSLGHEVDGVGSATEALELLSRTPRDVVLTDIAPEGMDGLRLASRVATLPRKLPVFVTSIVDTACQAAIQRARAEGIPLAGTFLRPLDRQVVGAALSVALGGTQTEEATGSGEDGLLGVDGPTEQFPPSRVLHLASRLDAAGTLEVEHAGERARVVLKGDRVLFASGVSGLLGAVAPELPDASDTNTAVGLAVARGHDAVTTMNAVAAALGKRVVGWSGAVGGRVRWNPASDVPRGSFPLPVGVLAMLARALRESRTTAPGWVGRAGVRLMARPPADSPEARWGLDAAATRILRACNAPAVLVEGLLAGADDARQRDLVHAIELLLLFGLAELDVPVVRAPAAAAAPTEAPAVSPPPTADPRVTELEVALGKLRADHPVDALGLGLKTKIGEDDVAQAVRDASRRYHPDLYFDAPRAVRVLAEACFAELNRHQSALARPEGLAEAKRLLAARAAGLPFVDEKTHQQARLAHHRGEAAWRTRELDIAADAFAEAYAKDPSIYEHVLLHALVGALARRHAPADGLALVEPLLSTYPRNASRTLETLGQLLKLAGRQEDALKRFQDALVANPDNHEAQRELRLHERRQAEAKAQAAAPKPGLFSGLFGKK